MAYLRCSPAFIIDLVFKSMAVGFFFFLLAGTFGCNNQFFGLRELPKGFFAFNLYVMTVVVGCSFFSLLIAIASADQSKTRSSLILKSSDTVFKQVIDSFLGRHQIFKNSPRNVTVLQSIYLLANLFLITYSLTIILIVSSNLIFPDFRLSLENIAGQVTSQINIKNHITVAITVLTLAVGIYWKLQSAYDKRWAYCADKFYKVAEQYIVVSGGRSPSRRATIELWNLRLSTAIDLLNMDMWAKRGFEKFFYETVLECAGIKGDSETIELIKSNRKSMAMLSEEDVGDLLRNSYM